MYCYQRDKVRASWHPLHYVSGFSKELLSNSDGLGLLSSQLRGLGAFYEIIHRWTRPNKRPEFNIKPIKIGERSYAVNEETVLEKPFCHLKQFTKVGYTAPQPTVLIVAPLSGHYATLLRDTVQTMLQDHNVYITDWISAYNVPRSEGDFDLDSYVDYLDEFYKHLGKGIHVMAVCQPTVPVLMAAALLEKRKASYHPTSMILMGGPVDTRINPTPINKLITQFPLSWFEQNMVSPIPPYAPGAGRKVTPGNLILAGVMQMHMKTHIEKHIDHIKNVANHNDKPATAHRTFYDEYLAVMDLPAEYFIQTVDKVFKQQLLAHNQMDYRGEKLDFKAITKTALMTIEGENDDITGLGQTYAAQTICSNIPEHKRDHFLRLDVGHYGIFSGSRWQKDIYPQVKAFIQKHHR